MIRIEQKSWEIVKAKNFNQAITLRNKIFKIIKKEFNIKENDPEKGINFLKIIKKFMPTLNLENHYYFFPVFTMVQI